MFESLRSLSDQHIIAGIKAARGQEHGGLLSVISHLIEFERRGLHYKLGFGSLHNYCTAELGYCESSAIRRMTAARTIARFPEIYALLESRRIHLSAITRIAKVLTPENAAVLLERVCKKSLREIEAIVAEYDPETALPRDRVKTIVLRVPVPVAAELKMGENHLRNGGKESSSVERSTLEEDRRAGDGEGSPAATATSCESIKFERHAVVQFSTKEEVLAKLDHVRSLASHRLPANAPLEQLIEFLADYFTEREDPRARHERREARNQPAKPHAAPRNLSARAIPARVRDEIFVRDKARVVTWDRMASAADQRTCYRSITSSR